jgi:hypothetical protein
MSNEITIETEIKNIKNQYKTEITMLEFKINALAYKSRVLSALINEDNINKMRKVNATDINDAAAIQHILRESPSIKLLNEYLDELKREIEKARSELEIKNSFYERIKRHVYSTCNHLWISDHFESPALMSMVGCTYCNVCGMTRDDA